MKSLQEVGRDLDPATRFVFNCLFWVGALLDSVLVLILLVALLVRAC
jgi:hypothetical protein